MEIKFKKLFSLAVLLSTAGMTARVAPFLNFRSVGRNTARKIVGTTSHHVNLYDMESFYGTFFITPGYERSFRPSNITECLFGEFLSDKSGKDCPKGRQITISGSFVGQDLEAGGLIGGRSRNNDKELMADNFLLARDFQSTITFTPRVQNFFVDFHFYMALDEWKKGLYFRVYGPIVHTRHDLKPKETVTQEGEIGYPSGFFSDELVGTDLLLKKALDFFEGKGITVPNITVKPLKFAKIKCKKDRNTCFAELRGEFGWNFLLEEDYHFGLNIQAAAPTGDRPDAEFLFEAQCGNGKHWEFGGGLSGHWTLWRSEDEEKHFDFVVEADVTHLFKAKQKRTFDLKKGTTQKPLSRYMLAQKISTPATGLASSGANPGDQNEGDVIVATQQFKNEFAPVANFSTQDVKVDISVQGDVVAMFNYTSRGFSWDVGYNLWARSCEDIELRDKDCETFPEKTWALKGNAQLIGFAADDVNAAIVVNDPIGLAATQSNATITQGTNPIDDFTNSGIDNFAFAQAFVAGSNTQFLKFQPTALDDPNNNIRTSVPPIFITAEDLDLSGAETKGISHKIFTHVNYTWVDREDWIPYVGVGGEVEFGQNDSDTKTTDNTSCDSCLRCSLSKWGLWLKGGVSFD